MNLKRRDFINLTAIASATGILASLNSFGSEQKIIETEGLKSMIDDVKPISITEREARIAKAQKLLIKEKMKALILDCSTSLKYFTGVNWGPSERTMVAIIPAKGNVKYICPGFEEDRLREQITIG
jgi:Xaa-Pro dipeptidase